jgi:hypothetical protein
MKTNKFSKDSNGPNLFGKVCVFVSQRGIAGGIAQHPYTTKQREAERGTVWNPQRG